MLKIIHERIRQKHRTVRYPRAAPVIPDRLRGCPQLTRAACEPACRACLEVCPTDSITRTDDGRLQLDLGRCLFCGACARACPQDILRFTTEHRLATRTRAALTIRADSGVPARATALEKEMLRLFGRSLKLRQVSAGGCNACEADVNVLTTVVFDLARFGIQFVAAPRHADGLLVTGPVSRNMELALKKTWAAVPAPKLVIAVGACAISGGIFRDHPETCNGVETLLPVDLFIPGCPPHPITILDGLLRLLGRLTD